MIRVIKRKLNKKQLFEHKGDWHLAFFHFKNFKNAYLNGKPLKPWHILKSGDVVEIIERPRAIIGNILMGILGVIVAGAVSHPIITTGILIATTALVGSVVNSALTPGAVATTTQNKEYSSSTQPELRGASNDISNGCLPVLFGKIQQTPSYGQTPYRLVVDGASTNKYRQYFVANYNNVVYSDFKLGETPRTDYSIDYLDSESINGLNLYAYCGNDPINKYDPTGHFPWLILAAFVFVGVTRAAANAIGQYQSTGQIDWFEVAVEGVYGGIMGALTVATAGAFSVTNLAIRIGVTALSMGIKNGLLMYNDTGNIEKAGIAGLEGMLKGGLIGFFSYAVFAPTTVTQKTFTFGAAIGILSGYLSGIKDKNQNFRLPWTWQMSTY